MVDVDIRVVIINYHNPMIRILSMLIIILPNRVETLGLLDWIAHIHASKPL